MLFCSISMIQFTNCGTALCRAKLHSLVKYDITSIVSFTSFNYLLTKASAEYINLSGKRAVLSMNSAFKVDDSSVTFAIQIQIIHSK